MYIGEPAVLGKNGVEKVLDLNLNQEDETKFETCATTIKNALKSVKY